MVIVTAAWVLNITVAVDPGACHPHIPSRAEAFVPQLLGKLAVDSSQLSPSRGTASAKGASSLKLNPLPQGRFASNDWYI